MAVCAAGTSRSVTLLKRPSFSQTCVIPNVHSKTQQFGRLTLSNAQIVVFLKVLSLRRKNCNSDVFRSEKHLNCSFFSSKRVLSKTQQFGRLTKSNAQIVVFLN